MSRLLLVECTLCMGLALLVTGCERKVTAQEALDGGRARVHSPTTTKPDLDSNNFRVDHPEQFPLVTAGEHVAAPELNVTGVVSPDVSRQVPVPSLATGRIVEIDARLGDEVKKGQVLFKVRSTDIAGAFSDLPPGRQERGIEQDPAHPRQHAIRARGDSEERSGNSPERRRQQRSCPKRPRRNNSNSSGSTPTILRVSSKL